MKIFAISDLHMNLELLDNIDFDTDLLLIAGDFSLQGNKNELELVFKKLMGIKNSQPELQIVICFGNSDVYAEEYIDEIKYNFPKIHILNNEIKEIMGIKIYGSPYSMEFMNWGFQYSNPAQCKKLTIPKEEVDIILNHEPVSHKKLSYIAGGIDIGNEELLKYIQSTQKKMIVIGGHCHECGGRMVKINNSFCYNVSKKGIYLNFVIIFKGTFYFFQ